MKDLEREAADAFAVVAYAGKNQATITEPARCRCAVLTAVVYAWGVHRERAHAALAEVEATVAEAARVERDARGIMGGMRAGGGEALPLNAAQTFRDAGKRLDASLRQVRTNMVGIERALDWVASVMGFDPTAARALLGVTRWRSDNVDNEIVEAIRRELVEELQALITRLEA
jgi:hypothetical protein